MSIRNELSRKLQTMRRRCAPIALAMGLLACSQTEPPVRTVVDFMADSDAIEMKLISCRADRRAAVKDAECANAKTAANRLALEDERAAFEKLREEATSELDAIRAERSRLERALDEREAVLRTRAEAKIAEGKTLTAEEARAIGIDPNGSLLVKPEDGGRDKRTGDGDTGDE
ncbi:MAG: hypothetical protein AAF290_06235 [Pseudomonadota bacterium]